ncbi:ATP-dependent zinc protease family protein [Kordiimonas marina]|uniref:ATP-dependent zinc protease family protein n=1 Tax=Kordiimonas marina TaxID=2872312 RepID=UPI001FF327A4|nr:RimK/LysX family protein [Kordiimonas marina]MCJ9430666.1 RimK/LysX family protein [Kordiimonas marina]
MKTKLIIGWREWVGLPAFGIEAIKAKIDTGAKTSALHAYDVTTHKSHGQEWAEFFIHPVQKRKRPEIRCKAPVVDEKLIKSSNGLSELRLVVSTELQLGPFTRTVQLTLTNRDEMGFRMLIGREALKGQYIVDSGVSYGLGDRADDGMIAILEELEEGGA